MGFKLTLEEIIKLLLAVVAIGVVVFSIIPLLIGLIFPTTEEQVSKGCFDLLTNAIYSLNEDVESASARCFLNPEWFVKGFDKGEKSPDSCRGDACLCLCTSKGFLATANKPDCGDDICRSFSKNLVVKETEQSTSKSVLVGGGFFEFFITQTENLIILNFFALEGKFGDDISEEDAERFKGKETDGILGIEIDASDNLPNEVYVMAYEGPAFNSKGTIRELTEKHAADFSLDPSLLAAIAIMESRMGLDNSCTSFGKTALTGCTWLNNCKVGCKCNKKPVFSDEGQIKCSAGALRSAYEQASGNADGSYSGCSKFSEDERWACIFRVYVSGKTEASADSLDYQNSIFSFYSQWKKYYEDQEQNE